MKEFYDHIHQNLELFNHWIENQSRLQISNDIFKPLIPVFQEANPTVNIHACQDCIIDMLIWCRREHKMNKDGFKITKLDSPKPEDYDKFAEEHGVNKKVDEFVKKLEETATKIETKIKGRRSNGKV